MSNPLLKPNDPRFSQPAITDAQGSNRFADGEQEAEPQAVDSADPADPADLYSVASTSGARPYEPRYETTAPSRGVALTMLALLGIAGALTGVLALSGLMMSGWILPLLAVVPATAAWILAYGDLSEMQTGARDEAGRGLTRLALWLGVGGMLVCLSFVAGMIWLGLSFLPDIL